MKRKIVSWTLAVAWCSVIFFMSSNNGEQSSDMSRLVMQLLNHLVGAVGITIPEIVIRKLAHFSEYLLLGIFLLSGFFNRLSMRRSLLFAFAVGTLYAASDEFHQAFVPGRGPAVHDVLIDASGVLCGALLMLWVLRKMGEGRRELGEGVERS